MGNIGQPPKPLRSIWSEVTFEASPNANVWIRGPHNSSRSFVKEYGASWVELTADYSATLDLTDPLLFAAEQGGSGTSPSSKAAIFQLVRTSESKLIVTIMQSASDGSALQWPNGGSKWDPLTSSPEAYTGLSVGDEVGTLWQFDKA